MSALWAKNSRLAQKAEHNPGSDLNLDTVRILPGGIVTTRFLLGQKAVTGPKRRNFDATREQGQLDGHDMMPWLHSRGSSLTGPPLLLTLKSTLPLPQFTPANPTLRPTAFDDDDDIFEPKMDGFRALSYVGYDETKLVSRKGNLYTSFPSLAAAIHIDLDCNAVLEWQDCHSGF
jgi:hypothetical protein